VIKSIEEVTCSETGDTGYKDGSVTRKRSVPKQGQLSRGISEGSNNVVVEARITGGTLETVSEPEKRIEKWFTARPLPQTNTVIDIPSLD